MNREQSDKAGFARTHDIRTILAEKLPASNHPNVDHAGLAKLVAHTVFRDPLPWTFDMYRRRVDEFAAALSREYGAHPKDAADLEYALAGAKLAADDYLEDLNCLEEPDDAQDEN